MTYQEKRAELGLLPEKGVLVSGRICISEKGEYYMFLDEKSTQIAGCLFLHLFMDDQIYIKDKGLHDEIIHTKKQGIILVATYNGKNSSYIKLKSVHK